MTLGIRVLARPDIAGWPRDARYTSRSSCRMRPGAAAVHEAHLDAQLPCAMTNGRESDGFSPAARVGLGARGGAWLASWTTSVWNPLQPLTPCPLPVGRGSFRDEHRPRWLVEGRRPSNCCAFTSMRINSAPTEISLPTRHPTRRSCRRPGGNSTVALSVITSART